MVREAKWIYAYSKSYRLEICFYILSGVLSVIMGLGSSVVSKYLIDAVTGHNNDTIAYAAAAFVGMGVFKALSNALSSRISARIEIRVTNDIRADIFDKMMLADWELISEYHSGDLLNRLNGDVSAVSASIVGFIPSLITRLLQFVLTFILILINDSVMAAIIVVGIPLSVLASRYVMRRLREYNRRQREAHSELTAFNEEALSNLQQIKSFSLVGHFMDRLREVQAAYKLIALKLNRFSVWTTLLYTLLGLVVSYGCYAWGVYRLWTGFYTYGTMTMFLMLAGYFSSSFSALVSLVPTCISQLTAAGRLMEFVHIPKERPSDPERMRSFGESGVSVSVEHALFAYAHRQYVFEDVSIHADAGEAVALVGPSGLGKTTMLRVLLGLVELDEGSATVTNGRGEVLEISSATRRLFAYVAQDNVLFSGSIRENLLLVRPDATEEMLISALTDACAWEFIEKLDGGMDFKLGEKGSGLSEGQIQRIAIARALLVDAPVLLMDEATSALDIATEQRLIGNLLARSGRQTVILTTHRDSLLSLCGRVYSIAGGTAVEVV